MKEKKGKDPDALESGKKSAPEKSLSEIDDKSICDRIRATSDLCNEERQINTSQLMKKLDEATAEAEKNRDLYMRSVADLDTYRRKVRREKEELAKFALQPFLETLLPSLDNLDIALKAMSDSGEAAVWADGIVMVRKQLSKAFEEFGVKEFGKEGKEFDPNEEECVSHQPSETIPENRVISVVRPGYSIHGRLIRPAAVIVSSGSKK